MDREAQNSSGVSTEKYRFFRCYNFGHECSPEVCTPVGRCACVDVNEVIVIPELSQYQSLLLFVVYYESIKRELKIRPIYECRYYERLKTKDEESTRLAYTGLLGELEQVKIKTRSINEMFVSVMGEYVFLK